MPAVRIVKQRILFVDEDANLLHSLQRLLRPQRTGWDMVFADDPQQAMTLLAAGNFDVVVSDIRMPGLDGAGFPAEIARLAPSSLRVILSGCTEQSGLFRSVGLAHQYLAKPCEPEAIIALMDRTRQLRGVLGDFRLRAVVAGLRNLPSPPALYRRLTEALLPDDGSTEAVAEIIDTDMAMTAGLLKVTNSSYFAVSSGVTSVSRAIRLLGLETVRALAADHGIFRRCPDKPGLAPQLDLMNEHGVALARLARRLAADDGADAAMTSDAYCAGLLSGIGALILLDADPDAYQKALATIDEADFEPRERAVFGASHAEIGAYLLGLWGFSAAMVEAVYYQLRPSDCRNQGRSALTYLHLARACGPPFPLLAKPLLPRVLLDRSYARRLAMGTEAGGA